MTRKEILEAAEKCVNGDRDKQYGSPEKSFKVIANMWNGYLIGKESIKELLTPTDVAARMVLFKMARIATGRFKEDSWIDAAGYCACGGELERKIKSESETWSRRIHAYQSTRR